MSEIVRQPNKLDRIACQKGRVASMGRRMLQDVVADCDCSEATLWLIAPDGVQILGALNHGPNSSVLESSSVPVGESVVGMVASNGIAASIGPDDWHNKSIDAKTGTKTQAMIAAPVYLRGALGGVLSAINPKSAKTFTADHLRTLVWKAYLLGLVLDDRHGS